MRIAPLCLAALLLSCAPTGAVPGPSPAATASALRAVFSIAPASSSTLDVSIPSRGSGALHVGVSADVWLEMSPRGARDVAAVDLDGLTIFSNAYDDLDLAYVREGARAEELRLARTRAAAARSVWDLRLGPGVSAVRIRDNRVEVLDRSGALRMRTEPAYAVDARSLRRDLTLGLDGSTLTATLDTSELTAPIAIDPAWTAISAKMPGGFRVAPAAFKLASGKVVVIGGRATGPAEGKRVELYDPATNTWTKRKDLTLTVEFAGGVVPVAGGTKILVSGGQLCTPTSCNDSDVSELYDPATETSVLAPVGVRAQDPVATLLPDGRVVVIGGRASPSWPASVRIWRTDNTWQVINQPSDGSEWRLNEGRREHAQTLLSNGKIMITGGKSMRGSSADLEYARNEAMVFDPATGKLTNLADMPIKRLQHAAIELTHGPQKGDVLVFGGQIASVDEASLAASAGALSYNFASNKWTIAPFMARARTFFGANMLTNGRILVTGGVDVFGVSFSAHDTAELFDPTAFAWKSAGKMLSPRAVHGSVSLDATTVLMIGGAAGIKEGFPTFLDTAEQFKLQPLGASCAADGECDSTFCADGVCCNAACTDQCAACDVAGKIGTCSVVTGAPHGTRAACSTDVGPCARTCDGSTTTECKFPPATAPCGVNACKGGVETHVSTCDGAGKCSDVPKSCGDLVCGADACKTVCASKADCVNPADFCESGKCLPQLSNGLGCTRDDACASGKCVDGVCCESKCEGQCEACDVPGQQGKCVPVKGKPHSLRPACMTDAANACNSKVCDGTNTVACAGGIGPCGDYGCDATELTCKKSCLNDGDCADGRECRDGKCVVRTSKCSTDRREAIATDLTATPCAPYLCRDGVCAVECRTSSDCQNGFVCDPSQKCISASAGGTGDEGGGCAYGGSSSSLFGAALGLLALGAARRRAR